MRCFSIKHQVSFVSMHR